MPPADAQFRLGLAGCLAGILLILFAASLELAGLAIGFPAAGSFGVFGLIIAIAGVVTGAGGVIMIERSARSPEA